MPRPARVYASASVIPERNQWYLSPDTEYLVDPVDYVDDMPVGGWINEQDYIYFTRSCHLDDDAWTIRTEEIAS